MKVHFLAFALLAVIGTSQAQTSPSTMKDIRIKMVTDKGDINITLLPSRLP